MAKIVKVWAREILDSRSIPTIEAVCVLDTGHTAITSVPSGTSTGTHEALELRDGDEKRYHGKGVLKAIQNINELLGPAVIGFEPERQIEIDAKLIGLDGTENKSNLGANSILAISQAICKAAALSQRTSLYTWVNLLVQQKGIKAPLRVPTPLFNMINGGLHGAGNLDFQEFWVVPASSKNFSDSIRMGSEIYLSLGENLKRRGAIHSVGDEGGYAPNLFTNADALELLVEVIRQSPYAIGRDVFIGLDVAASVFYKDGEYTIRDKSAPMDEVSLIEYYKELNNTYHLALLEDPLSEDAWDGWSKLNQVLGGQMAIVGDDLLATNPKRVDEAIQRGACNTILVKPNQIGTVSETLDVIKKSVEAGWRVIVSHRSGETNDWFIADFAVGVGANYVKFGAPSRGERIAKYNRLSSVELELSYAKK